MKFSLILSSYLPGELPEIIHALDNTGFYGVAMPDHVVHPASIAPLYPYGEGSASDSGVRADTPQLDPWLVGAFLAAASSKLHFMTSVYLPVLRHPLATAKAAATLSGLLGSRFTFGVGSGWMREEYECLGIPFTERGARLDEIVEIFKRYWSGGQMDYQGRFYNFPLVGTSPAPSQPIPLYFGGHSEKMLRRAARHGNGWICSPKLETLEYQIVQLRKLREEFGRADEPFEFVGICAKPNPTLVEKMAQLGITHMVLFPPWKPGTGSVKPVEGEKALLIERLGEQIAAFR